MKRVQLVVKPDEEQAIFLREAMKEVDDACERLIDSLGGSVTLGSALEKADTGIIKGYLKLAYPEYVKAELIKKDRQRNLPTRHEEIPKTTELHFACNRGDEVFEVIGKVYIRFLRGVEREKFRTGVTRKLKNVTDIDSVVLYELHNKRQEWMLEYTMYEGSDKVDNFNRQFQ